MPSVFTPTGQAAALAAAAAAAEGAREDAFIASWVATLGTSPELQQLRDGVVVWQASHSGAIATDAGDLLITASGVTQTSISDADRDSGAWEFRIVNTTSGEYYGHTCSATGGPDDLLIDGDLTSGGSHLPGTIRFHPPVLDAVAAVPATAGSVVLNTAASAISLALSSAQPQSGSTIVVGVAQRANWPGFASIADLSPTGYWASDLSALRPNVDGTGAITGPDQIVRRINLAGSAGAHLYDPSGVGVYVRQSASGTYYLEGDRARRFILSAPASALIGASAGEVIIAAVPRSALGYDSDSWFHDALFSIGDGAAGITLPNAAEARFYVRQSGGGDIYGEAAAAQGAPNLFTWAHAGGALYGAVGFNDDPPSIASAGDLFDVVNPAALFGVYHGSFAQCAADVYGIAFFSTKLTTAQRAAAQWWLHRRMIAVPALSAPSVSDSAGNSYSMLAAADDGVGLLTAIFACHNATPGPSGSLAITVTGAGQSMPVLAGQAFEVANLLTANALDQIAVGTNDGTAGTLSVSSPATQQTSEIAIVVAGLRNDDTVANMTAPSGWTEAGTSDNASAELGFVLAHKLLTAIGAVTAAPTWDSGSAAGGAAAALVTLRAGAGEGLPSGGGGSGESIGIALNTMRRDMDQVAGHQYAIDGVPTTWDYGLHAIIGAGSNPPPIEDGYTAPHFVAVGLVGAAAGAAPGAGHNWRIRVLRVVHMARINGQWVKLSDFSTPSAIGGQAWSDFASQLSLTPDIDTSAGYEDVGISDDGSIYRFWGPVRDEVPSTGTERRVVAIRAALTLINEGGTDDRAAAQVGVMASGDYYKTASAVSPNYQTAMVGNFWKPALWPDTSWHTAHDMVTDEEINEHIAWGLAEGIYSTATGGGAPATGFISLQDMIDDVDPTKPNEYVLHGVPLSFDWASHSRAGFAQPPTDFTAQLAWFVAFTNANASPGSHNWAIGIKRLIALEYRSGAWVITKNSAAPSEMDGDLVTQWSPEIKVPDTVRISNGFFEIYMPDSGGAAHYWGARFPINPVGATYRMTLVQCGLTVWNTALADDREAARQANTAAVMQAGMDYWRSLSAPYVGGGVNNKDGGISRCREIGLIESPSWHCVHTIPIAGQTGYDPDFLAASHAEIAALLGL